MIIGGQTAYQQMMRQRHAAKAQRAQEAISLVSGVFGPPPKDNPLFRMMMKYAKPLFPPSPRDPDGALVPLPVNAPAARIVPAMPATALVLGWRGPSFNGLG